jgi:hypothetical protein
MQVLMDSIAHFAGGQASREELCKIFHDYLQRFPSHRPAVVQWLDEAVVSGRVSGRIPEMLAEELKEPPAETDKARPAAAADAPKPLVAWRLPWQRYLPGALVTAAVLFVAVAIYGKAHRESQDDQSAAKPIVVASVDMASDRRETRSETLSPEAQKDVEETLTLAADNLRQAKNAPSNQELVYFLSEGTNNLNDLLEHIAQVDPNDTRARQFREDAATLYLGKARDLLGADQLAEANSMTIHGLEIMPDNGELLRLRREVLAQRCSHDAVNCDSP